MFRAWLTKGLLIAVLSVLSASTAFADTICCKRGNSDWWTSSYKCSQAGGHQVGNKQCRNDNHNGNFGNNFLRPSWWVGDGSNRVCCQRRYKGGWQDWWSTARECVRAGGDATANKVCRNHTSDPPYYPGQGNGQWNDNNNGQWNNNGNGNGGWNDGQQWIDPSGNPDRRVCCYRDGHAWWSSWIDCKRGWGQETANKVCRN